MAALHSIELETIKGEQASLADFAGQVLLIVNVASKCGLTTQYEGLERLYETYRERGFAVLGFPSNDFAGQEPGGNDEIASFCTGTFGVRFPLFAKTRVTGADKHPLYRALIALAPELVDGEALRETLRSRGMTPNVAPEILWNFEKFLVDRDGQVVTRFAPDTAPEDDRIVAAIEQALC